MRLPLASSCFSVHRGLQTVLQTALQTVVGTVGLCLQTLQTVLLELDIRKPFKMRDGL